MKISTKLISISSIIISICLLLSVTVGIFITKNNLNNVKVADNNEIKTKNWEFFNKQNYNSGTKIDISKYVNKMNILYYFTNFSVDYNYTKINFIESRINKNILSFCKNTISKIEQFKEIDKYYINVKYELINDSILIDTRWALKQHIVDGKETQLYFSQFIISIIE